LDIRANKWVYVAEMSIPRVDAGAGSISLLWLDCGVSPV
jgi:hypothetical protein